MSGRIRKAEQFYEAAETIREFAADEGDVGDAYVTLCVHAGIAAADVICCVALGRHASGESHNEAIELLRQATPGSSELPSSLSTLLRMKTRAGYGSAPVSADEPRRAQRAAARLLDAARQRRTG